MRRRIRDWVDRHIDNLVDYEYTRNFIAVRVETERGMEAVYDELDWEAWYDVMHETRIGMAKAFGEQA